MLSTPELIEESAQRRRLGALVPRWLNEVPLYRGTDARNSAGSAARAMEFPGQVPLITKREIRLGFPRNFLPEGVDLDTLLDEERIEIEHTSGTSEERTPLLLKHGWWAEQEARALRRNRVVAQILDQTPDARRVTISSPVCNGDVCYTGVPTRNDRIVGQSLHVSLSRHPFLWSAEDLGRMVRETTEWQPQFLDVDPVYGVVFARYCEQRGIRLPSLQFIICSYEFVSVLHRRILERAFGVPVFNLYGSTETGHLLMENERGEMAPSLETAFLEVIDPDRNGVGHLVVTTLTNDYMPLIRYRIGDLIERHIQPYRTTYVVHGRAADAIELPLGEMATTWQVDQCFEEASGMVHYQLRQASDGSWVLWYVPDESKPTTRNLEELRVRLTQRIGSSGRIAIRSTDALLPEASGKFRLICPNRRQHPAR